MSERLLLTLDGSTPVCSAALLRPSPTSPLSSRHHCQWEVLARRSEGDGPSQAKVLLRLVDEMVGEMGGDPACLGAIVVGIGPGTFTGVRIAVATARALSLALDIPVLGVSTLAALAAGAVVRGAHDGGPDSAAPEGAGPSVILPVIDARRRQLFYGVYHAVRESPVLRPPDDLHLPKASRPRYVRSVPYSVCDRDRLGNVISDLGEQRLDGEVLVVGTEHVLSCNLPAEATVVDTKVEAETLILGQNYLEEPPGEYLRGNRLSPWLLRALGQEADGPLEKSGSQGTRLGGVGTPEAVKPIYVRAPDADIHILKMRDPFAGETQEPDAPDGEVGSRA